MASLRRTFHSFLEKQIEATKERRNNMSYNQYTTLSEDVRKKLIWLQQPFYYIYKDSSGSILRGILYEVSKVNFDKAYVRLSGEMSGEILNGDTVYVLPNCRIPMFKLTDYLKGEGARQTGDVTEATKIIGHIRVREQPRGQALNSSMLIEIDGPHFLSKFQHTYWGTQVHWDKQQQEFESLMSSTKDAFEGETEKVNEVIISKGVWGESNNFSKDPMQTLHLMTPTAAWVLYNHILHKIPVINEDYIYEKIGKPIILDEDGYKSIKDMLASQDEESQKVGATILANCDINPSLYWIWKLANQFSYAVRNQSRIKNIRLFTRMSHWDKLSGLRSEEFIKYLTKKGGMTTEYFGELIKTAARDRSSDLKSDVFTITLQPKIEYKEFSDDSHRFEFNRDPVTEEVEVEEETDEEV